MTKMMIKCKRHVDCSEPDENGLYLYYYEYDLYEFSIGKTVLRAISYTDEPEKVKARGFLQNGKPIDMLRYDSPDVGAELFREAKAYLSSIGKTKFKEFYTGTP